MRAGSNECERYNNNSECLSAMCVCVCVRARAELRVDLGQFIYPRVYK
jgi:hypothetical protein